MTFIVLFESSILLGFLLDAILGDASILPHPVVIIGKYISFLEKRLRDAFKDSKAGARAAGGTMAAIVVITTLVIMATICILSYVIHPLVFLIVHSIFMWKVVAMRGLGKEARGVYDKLGNEENLGRARRRLSRIVGRDTDNLNEEEIVKATVETVAENYSDGVVAPLFYAMIGGAPLAMTYKAINTMDSMVGYKNEKYINFGRVPAHMDDVAGFVPSRVGALMWMISAALVMRRGGKSWSIWRRDGRNHASPNAGQTEAACAGALGVELAGPSYYFGKYYDKETIGDAERAIEADDILKTNKMMYIASVIAVIVCIAISMLWMGVILLIK